MTCDDYQTAFDQRSAGAEFAVPPAGLDAHLGSCGECTAYASLSRKLNTAMTTTIALSPAPLDLDAMRAKLATLDARARRYARVRPVVFAGIAVVVAALLSLDGHRHPATLMLLNLASFGGFCVLMYWLTGREQPRRLRQLAQLRSAQGRGFIDGYRAELDRRIRASGFLSVNIVGGGYLIYSYVRLGWYGHTIVDVALLAIGFVSLVQFLRLRRERAALA